MVDKVRDGKGNFGYNAATEEFGDSVTENNRNGTLRMPDGMNAMM